MFGFHPVGVWAFVIVAGVSGPACSEHAVPAPDMPTTGSLSVALAALGSEGNRYRLREGDFDIRGPEQRAFSAADYREADVARFDLLVGDYGIELGADWVLERQQGASYQTVVAELISDNPEDFRVREGQTTRVNFQFFVDGEVAFPGEGVVEVGIGVSEAPAGADGGADGGGMLCGNDTVDPGEECDDGNARNTDLCTNACELAQCGDGFVWRNQEACDDGNELDGDSCGAQCVWQCGNGVLDPTESCDDGNLDDNDECSSSCSGPFCGDGILNPGEECDDGNGMEWDECTAWCTLAECGDGALGPNEECDDGNDSNLDDCTTLCLWHTCGDGFVSWLEQCDDANVNAEDSCVNGCTFNQCGDGNLYAAVTDVANQNTLEQCDEGAGNSDTVGGCSTSCTLNNCGNGIVEAFEECDDGNADAGAGSNSDSCTAACRWNRCGDGEHYVTVTDPQSPYSVEECDDGNSNEADNCTSSCTWVCPAQPQSASCWPRGAACDYPDKRCTCNDCGQWSCASKCGNGVVEADEQCDDGNLNPCDGCLPTCVSAQPVAAPSIAPTLISTDSVWCGDVEVNANLVVLQGATLFIGPGTISFADNVTLQIRGYLSVGGAQDDEALFTSQPQADGGVGTWYGIDVRQDLGAEAVLEHFVVEDANRGLAGGGAASAVRDGEFRNNVVGLFQAYEGLGCGDQPLWIDGVSFVENGFGVGGYEFNLLEFTGCHFVGNDTGISRLWYSTVEDSNFSNNGTAIDYAAGGTIRDSAFVENGIGLRQVNATVLERNVIVGSTEAAIDGTYGATLRDNTLLRNGTGVIVRSQSTLVGNTLCESGDYDLVSSTAQSVIAEDNWWCTTDSATIAERISDVFDGNPAAGPVFYEPFLQGPSDDAPPDPGAP